MLKYLVTLVTAQIGIKQTRHLLLKTFKAVINAFHSKQVRLEIGLEHARFIVLVYYFSSFELAKTC
jgi:hypothetical protein